MNFRYQVTYEVNLSPEEISRLKNFIEKEEGYSHLTSGDYSELLDSLCRKGLATESSDNSVKINKRGWAVYELIK